MYFFCVLFLCIQIGKTNILKDTKKTQGALQWNRIKKKFVKRLKRPEV